MTGQTYIGGSLSKCVFDIARGAVAYDSVAKISTQTAAKTEREWAMLVYSYAQDSWHFGPTKEEQDIMAALCTGVAWRLYNDGKIEQPRLNPGNKDNLDRSLSHWFDAATQEPVVRPDFQQSSLAVEKQRHITGLIKSRMP